MTERAIVAGCVVQIGDGGKRYRVVRMFLVAGTPVSAELRDAALIERGPQSYWHFKKARPAGVAHARPLNVLCRVPKKASR